MIKGPGRALKNSMLRNALKLRGNVREGYVREMWTYLNKNMNYSVLKKGKLVGFAIVKRDGSTWNIQLICTLPRMGFGKQLVHKIVTNAKKRGAQNIQLHSIPSSIPFYEKLGFRYNTRPELLNTVLGQRLATRILKRPSISMRLST